MRWQTKSLIQRFCAALPAGGAAAYGLLQSLGGRLRSKPDPTEDFLNCVTLVQRIQDAGGRVAGARIMEVGTGWALNMPLALHLCGAASIATFDLYRYLRPARVEQTVDFIHDNRARVREIFLPVADSAELDRRLEALCQARGAEGIMKAACIDYHAPADATHTDLPPASIDIQFSYTVFEHIPAEVLTAILREASRVLKPGGLAVHHVDPSDHYSHVDPTISKINFLRFSREEWDRLAGNQFAYHNRLRSSDYKRIVEESGHRLVTFAPHVDEECMQELKNGFPLHADYAGVPPEILCGVIVLSISTPTSAPDSAPNQARA